MFNTSNMYHSKSNSNNCVCGFSCSVCLLVVDLCFDVFLFVAHVAVLLLLCFFYQRVVVMCCCFVMFALWLPRAQYYCPGNYDTTLLSLSSALALPLSLVLS